MIQIKKLTDDSVVLTIGSHADWQRRVHDLDGSLGRFETVVKAVEAGYRFDDEKANRYLELLHEAISTLEENVDIFRRIGSEVLPSGRE